MPLTKNNLWPYPDRYDKPYFEKIEIFYNHIDSDVYNLKNSEILTFNTMGELTGTESSDGRVAFLRGYHEPGDGAEGFYQYATSKGPDDVDGGTIISGGLNGAWVRLYRGVINIKWFGAKGDGVADDTAATQAATAAMGSGESLYFPSGTYLCSVEDGLHVIGFDSLSDISIVGENAVLKTNDFDTPDGTFASLSSVGTAVTAVTELAHGLISGDQIAVGGTPTEGAYSGIVTVTVTNTTTFTYTALYSPGSNITNEGYFYKTNFERRFVRLDNCINVNIDGIKFEGQPTEKLIAQRVGYQGVRLIGSCQNVRVNAVMENLAFGLNAGDQGDSVRLDVTLDCELVGYPVSLNGSGHSSTYNIKSNHALRGAYITSCNDSIFNVQATNYELVGCLISGALVDGELLSIKNTTINFTDPGTTELKTDNPDNSLSGIFMSGFVGTGSPVYRNLKLSSTMTCGAEDLWMMPIQCYTYSNIIYDTIEYDAYLDRSAATGTTLAGRRLLDIGLSSAGVGTFRNQRVRRCIGKYASGYSGDKGWLSLNCSGLEDLFDVDYVSGCSDFRFTAATGKFRFSRQKNALAAIVAQLGSIPAEMNILEDENLTSDLTIPSNIALNIGPNTTVTVATGQTLTINGPFTAGNYQCFTETGTGRAVLGGSNDKPNPAWWGLDQIQSFTDLDATPSVRQGCGFKTANTLATTITDFDDGVEGQTVKVVFGDPNTTVDFTGTNLKGNAGADWAPSQNDHMTCVYDGTNWYCDISNNT